MSNQAARTGVGVVMVGPESRLFCRLDSGTQAAREQQRFKALVDLGLLKAEIVPAFEEATQTAARFLDAPISILGLMTQDRQWIKSSVGLSISGLMNELAASRQLQRSETFCTYVVDSHQVLAIDDTATDPFFARSILFQNYGIRSYLGAPLLTASGHCLGTLAVMDLVPRTFTGKDKEFLAMMARWAESEVERNCLLKAQGTSLVGLRYARPSGVSKSNLVGQNGHQPKPETDAVKVKLLSHLSQELRTPLTSVMGMTSVLRREIYGPLSGKQKEYLEIIHDSGQQLVELVDEILSLGTLDENSQKLHVTSVDIEMLCQQATQKLEQVAKHRQQQMRLSVEPTNRIWLLDKEKVRQILYYLIFSVIQSAAVGCVVRIDVSGNSEKLNIALWASHPWLEDGVPQGDVYSHLDVCHVASNGSQALTDSRNFEGKELITGSSLPSDLGLGSITSLSSALASERELTQPFGNGNKARESLGLLLSCQLAELHGGEITVQGWSEWGYRYVVSLPHLAIADERL